MCQLYAQVFTHIFKRCHVEVNWNSPATGPAICAARRVRYDILLIDSDIFLGLFLLSQSVSINLFAEGIQ